MERLLTLAAIPESYVYISRMCYLAEIPGLSADWSHTDQHEASDQGASEFGGHPGFLRWPILPGDSSKAIITVQV